MRESKEAGERDGGRERERAQRARRLGRDRKDKEEIKKWQGYI